MTTPESNIYCTEDNYNHDFYYASCIVSSKTQCGEEEQELIFHDESTTHDVDTSGLKRTGG